MSTAGWPKLQAGWLDPSTAAVHGFVTNVLVAFDRHGLLVETAANAPFNPALEALDWATIAMECGLIFVVLSVRRFRWLLAVAAVFHLAVLLTMQINFATNIVLYALLVPTAALAAQAQHAAAFGRLRRALSRRFAVAFVAIGLGAVSTALLVVTEL